MTKRDFKTQLKEIHVELEKLKGDSPAVSLLVGFSETMVGEYDKLSAQYQALKDKFNKLTGEQGQPSIRKQTKGKNTDISSEENRKKGKKNKQNGKRGSKKSQVKATQTITLSMKPEDLPRDAKKDGVKRTIIQDVKITVENTEFIRQIYYSPSENTYYLTPLPPGYEGEYGPNIKSWTNALYADGQMTTDKIKWFFNTAGVLVSKPTVYNFLVGAEALMADEKSAIVKSGLLSTPYQHLDDTNARENGKNRYVNVLGNDYYSAYFTLPRKDRLTIIKMLSLGELKFLINGEAFALMAVMHVPQKFIDDLQDHVSLKYYTETSIDAIVQAIFGDKNKNHRKRVIEAMAIAAYRKSPYAIEQLIVDDAPQFKLITELLGLCWIHEGRHYKKLNPIFKKNIDALDSFIDEFWNYYHKLLDYKENPSPASTKKLYHEFDALFSRQTGYELLDKHIALTYKKSKELLLVLEYPNAPLHNNSAELMARYQARTRDVHLHTMSEQGTAIKDGMATVSGTARKLSVNLFHYIFDRITMKFEMTSLAELITSRAMWVPENIVLETQ